MHNEYIESRESNINKEHLFKHSITVNQNIRITVGTRCIVILNEMAKKYETSRCLRYKVRNFVENKILFNIMN